MAPRIPGYAFTAFRGMGRTGTCRQAGGTRITHSAEHDAAEQNAGKWISLIRQYSDLKELNSCIINELITKILVGDKRRVNGEKVQSIEIHYRFIGNLTDSGNGETIQ